jgi:hypothetical protein
MCVARAGQAMPIFHIHQVYLLKHAQLRVVEVAVVAI